MAAAEAEGRNLLLPVDDAEVQSSFARLLRQCMQSHALRRQCLVQLVKSIPVSCRTDTCMIEPCCCAGLRAVPALGARQRVQAWYARGPLSVHCSQRLNDWVASKSTHAACAGDCIHLFHVVTHDTARSLECFSRPMEEDLPPEYHQELLVRVSFSCSVVQL